MPNERVCDVGMKKKKKTRDNDHQEASLCMCLSSKEPETYTQLYKEKFREKKNLESHLNRISGASQTTKSINLFCAN